MVAYSGDSIGCVVGRIVPQNSDNRRIKFTYGIKVANKLTFKESDYPELSESAQ